VVGIRLYLTMGGLKLSTEPNGLSKKMLAAHLRKTLERRNGANSYVCRMAATMSDDLLIEAHSLFVEQTVAHLERARTEKGWAVWHFYRFHRLTGRATTAKAEGGYGVVRMAFVFFAADVANGKISGDSATKAAHPSSHP
jgi:hypothetical protein